MLQLEGIKKHFPGVKALDGVDLDLREGELHVLFGENGAGKSTLISLIAGVYPPTSGQIKFRGKAVELSSVNHARRLGISAVFQELSLVPQMTVEENIFLGDEPTMASGMFLSKGNLEKRARELLEQLDFPLEPRDTVGTLSRAEQQMVEIAKAFRSDLSVLILDEPTASLTDHETDNLFKLISDLKTRGVGIIYITHRMNEIRRIGDRVTVLRDGSKVGTHDVGDVSDEEMIHMMTGRVISEVFPTMPCSPGKVVFRTEGLTTTDGQVRDVSIHVRSGEIVGLAGLVGSGKSEVARACFGLEPIAEGKITFEDQDVTGASPRRMQELGFYYVPSNRKEEGLAMMLSCRENMTLPACTIPPICRHGFLNRAEEKKISVSLASTLELSPPNVDRMVGHFSGGNQQKVMLAKSLTRKISMFAFDEPTVGVDVGTRTAIYRFIGELCDNGAAILLISSDLPEVLNLSNRLYVFFRGALSAELEEEQITEKAVLGHYFGHDESSTGQSNPASRTSFPSN